jgi:hypothetical protein
MFTILLSILIILLIGALPTWPYRAAERQRRQRSTVAGGELVRDRADFAAF